MEYSKNSYSAEDEGGFVKWVRPGPLREQDQGRKVEEVCDGRFRRGPNWGLQLIPQGPWRVGDASEGPT